MLPDRDELRGCRTLRDGSCECGDPRQPRHGPRRRRHWRCETVHCSRRHDVGEGRGHRRSRPRNHYTHCHRLRDGRHACRRGPRLRLPGLPERPLLQRRELKRTQALGTHSRRVRVLVSAGRTSHAPAVPCATVVPVGGTIFYTSPGPRRKPFRPMPYWGPIPNTSSARSESTGGRFGPNRIVLSSSTPSSALPMASDQTPPACSPADTGISTLPSSGVV